MVQHNRTDGGDGGKTIPTSRRIEINKELWKAGTFDNRPPLSAASRFKISSALTGKSASLSAAGRERKRIATTLAWQDPEKRKTRTENIRAARINNPITPTEETCKKISESLKQRNTGRTEYYSDPKHCPCCNTKIPYENRNNETCSRTCGKIMYHRRRKH